MAALLPALLALAWLAGFCWYAATVPGQPAPSPTVTDAIVVLTGGSERVAAGLAQLRAGLGRVLFVSGVDRGVGVAELLHLSRQAVEPLRCCVVLGHDADNTRGNARETAAWMRSQHYHSMRMVTANYHMRRALLEFRHAMPELSILPQPVFPAATRSSGWWMTPRTIELIVSEYDKYLVASAEFGLSGFK